MDQYCAVAKYNLEIKLALDLHVNLPILKKSQYIVGNINFPRVATVADWGKEKDSEINVFCYRSHMYTCKNLAVCYQDVHVHSRFVQNS